MNATEAVVRVFGRAAARRFDEAARDPAAAQLAVLREIVGRNRDTEFGRAHGFGSVATLADFRAAAPPATWEDLAPLVERMARGERNVLTAEDPVFYARTSGTSGDPKLIPMTAAARRRDQKDPMRVFLWHSLRAHPDLFAGQVLSLVSPAEEGRTPGGTPYGSTSGRMYRDMPSLVRRAYCVPYEVFGVEDYRAEYYALMRIGIGCDVSFLCTANPTSVLKLCETADERSDELLRDLADGTLAPDVELPPEVRAAVERRIAPDPERARRLEQARARRGGRLLPADYWPRLALVGCWKGGTVGYHVSRFPEWFDPDGARPVAVRDWGWISSEARGSIPLDDDGAAGPLAISTNLYEFVPAEDVDGAPDDPARWGFLGAHELEDGAEYHVFLTTWGGLYRYDINDVLRVTGRHHATPLVEFVRKGRDMTSLTGEKLSANQVIAAVEGAAGAARVRVAHFEAQADVEGSRYVLLVELARPAGEAELRELLAGVDERLGKQNLEYRGKRDSLRLGPPELRVMRAGWHDRQRRSGAARGGRLFQYKAPVLSTPEPGRTAGSEEPETVVQLA